MEPHLRNPQHTIGPSEARGFLRSLFDAMVDAADPERLLPSRLPSPPPGRTLVLGAGKAAAAMARAVEDHWPGPLSGMVVTKYGHGLPCRHIKVVEAGHPLPDGAGWDAAARMLASTQDLSKNDLVLALFSGGGSALLTLPAPGITREDLREVNRQLLRGGVPIAKMNCVRKHLSAIAGGRLGAACAPARVMTFLISDVPGDDPAAIASGPTVADPTTLEEALAVADEYHLDLPPAVRRHLMEGRDETPKPGDPRLANSEVVMLATPAQALAAAAARARAAGLRPVVLGADLQGEAREVAAKHAELVDAEHAATRAQAGGSPRCKKDLGAAKGAVKPAPMLLLSGGETTVTVRGGGRGGRNSEYLLALSLALARQSGGSDALRVYALAADTDGIDGTEDNAGAFLSPDTLERAAAAGLDPQRFLDSNNGYEFFRQLGDLLITGPTCTNINDFRAILAPQTESTL